MFIANILFLTGLLPWALASSSVQDASEIVNKSNRGVYYPSKTEKRPIQVVTLIQ